MIYILIAIVLSYIIGSIPTAYLFGKYTKGIDIRQHGSGNVGATNVFRVLGKWPGIFVLVVDIMKGVIAVAFIPQWFALSEVIIYILCAVSVVCGHNWTMFLNFKGGKGIATSLGVLIGLTIVLSSIRIVLLGTIVIWAISFCITGIVSLSSILAAIVLPFFMIFSNQELELIFLGVIFCLFVVVRHRPNIKRIFEGTESRVKLPFHKS